ncbi:MAG: SH3 domain-containing protein [Caldisericia bacterium]
MGLSAKKLLTVVICFMLFCPVFLTTGCGEEKAEYSVFWKLDNASDPHLESEIKDLLDKIGNGNRLRDFTLEMSPGEEKTVDFTIWNKHKTPGIKSTFKLTSDSDFISFPNSRIEIVSAEDEHNITVMVGVLVNIRKKPTTSSEILLNTTEQKEYTYISQAPGEDDDKIWIEIELEDGRTGWVRSDMTSVKSDLLKNFEDAVNVPVTIKLPEEVEFPVDAEIKITPSKGEPQTLSLHITEADWWSVSWVASGSDSLDASLNKWKKKSFDIEIYNHSNLNAEFSLSSFIYKHTQIEGFGVLMLEPGESKIQTIHVSRILHENVPENENLYIRMEIEGKRIPGDLDDVDANQSHSYKSLILKIDYEFNKLEVFGKRQAQTKSL